MTDVLRVRFDCSNAGDVEVAAAEATAADGSLGLGVRHDELELLGLVLAATETSTSCIAAGAGEGRGECRRMPRMPLRCWAGEPATIIGGVVVVAAASLQRLRSMMIGIGLGVDGSIIVAAVVVAVCVVADVNSVMGTGNDADTDFARSATVAATAIGDVWSRNASKLSTELREVFRSP